MSARRAFVLGAVVGAGVLAAVGSASGAAPKVPTGVFRTTITDADLKARGVTDIAENHGTYTLRLLPKGRWSFHQVARNSLQDPNHAGTYTARRNGITFTDTGFDVGFTASLSFDGKHLRFKIVSADIPELRVIFGAHPWTKVGS